MKLISILFCALLLSACQSAPSQPLAAPAPTAPSSAELVEQVNGVSNKRFDGVEHRITLLQ